MVVERSEAARFRDIHAAFVVGDLAALRAAVDDPGVVPNGVMPASIGTCLTYAVYHSPLSFIRELLEIGADPSPPHDDGFPPLFAAVWMSTRTDTLDVVRLLLSFGADPDQRGHNDYGPLHAAALSRDPALVRLLLESGADPSLRTRIDDMETPLELAVRDGLHEVVDVLERWDADA